MRKLHENFAEWDTGEWVHYTNHDMLMIAPPNKSFHTDPVGIYFFPPQYQKKATMWLSMKHCFTVTLKPTAKILDMASLNTFEKVTDFVYGIGGINAKYKFLKQTERYPSEDMKRVLRMAWESLRNEFTSKSALWNKRIREYGYDAIFDDTGTIHIAEVQLVVLNPRIIQTLKMRTLKLNVFQSMEKVTQDLYKICKQYGPTEVEWPKKVRSGWSTTKSLESYVRIHVSDDKYATFKITPEDSKNPTYLYISLIYSMPRLNYGVGERYNLPQQKYDEPIERLNRELKRIFHASE